MTSTSSKGTFNELERNGGIPLYRQLEQQLRSMVEDGTLAYGQMLPSEMEMIENYQVSRTTIRQAIKELEAAGLVRREQGKGTFVAKPKYSRNIRRLSGFTQMCEQMGVVPGGRMLDNRLIAADEKTAKKLGVAPGSDIIYIHRLRYANNEPVIIERNYFPPKYAELLQRRFDNESLFAYLKEHMGVICKESEKLIELCHVTGEEANMLDVKRGDYMMFVKSTAYDQNREPIYVGVQIINGERFSLNVYEKVED